MLARNTYARLTTLPRCAMTALASAFVKPRGASVRGAGIRAARRLTEGVRDDSVPPIVRRGITASDKGETDEPAPRAALAQGPRRRPHGRFRPGRPRHRPLGFLARDPALLPTGQVRARAGHLRGSRRSGAAFQEARAPDPRALPHLRPRGRLPAKGDEPRPAAARAARPASAEEPPGRAPREPVPDRGVREGHAARA